MPKILTLSGEALVLINTRSIKKDGLTYIVIYFSEKNPAVLSCDPPPVPPPPSNCCVIIVKTTVRVIHVANTYF